MTKLLIEDNHFISRLFDTYCLLINRPDSRNRVAKQRINAASCGEIVAGTFRGKERLWY